MESLRRWSLDYEYGKCVDTINGSKIFWKRYPDARYAYGEDIRKVAADSCKCAVYGKEKK
jgi:hypothetical protein